MSHILSQWLNCDVNLSKEISPSELDSAFRNGFLLGELLDRLALQDDFKASYVNSSSVDASIKNFSSLEQTLREKLAITLTSNSAYDLITAKPGAAAKLLYQIKSSILPKHFHLTSTENDVKYKPRPIDKAITGDVAVDKNGPRWVRNTPPPLPAPKWTDAEESYPPSEDCKIGHERKAYLFEYL